MRGNPDLDDTIRRLQAFEAAGADVLMAPGLPDLAAVRAVCSALSKPFNFMAGIKGKSFSVAELRGSWREADQPRHIAVSRRDDRTAERRTRGQGERDAGLRRHDDADARAERLHGG